MKAEIWGHQAEIRPGVYLVLRRIKNYTTTGTKDGTYSTELVCLKKTLPIAQCKDQAAGVWLLEQWVKVIDPILYKYESQSYVEPASTINTADAFARAIELKRRELKGK